MTTAPPLVVFCDFDGTMTDRDMVIAVCEKFCPPEWKQVVEQIVDRKISILAGVIRLMGMIPSAKKDEIIEYATATVRWRPGLAEFLHFCKDNGITFVVCSGGLQFFIEPMLKIWEPWITKVFSTPASFSDVMIQLKPLYPCETETTCKVRVMDQFPGAIRILIGDSITDVHGARHAQRVFARDRLKTYLDAENVPYHSYETFHDILNELQKFGTRD